MKGRSFCLALALASATRAQAQGASPLPRSTPEREGVSSTAVLSFLQAADTSIDAMNSFMLVRHGRVVAEGWWSPYQASTQHILYSLSKSFTSTAVGLAIAEGKLSLDDQVVKFFPDDAPAQPSANLRAMRVRDLLRMQTGHVTEPSIRTSEDSTLRDATWAKRFLMHPVTFKPGTHFLYNSGATYMLSAIVQKVTGQTVRDYLTPRLFVPLGIESPTWVSSPQGINAGAYGLAVRTEDIAKLGELYLQKGKWKGQQLIPAAWVAEATSRQTSNGSAPTSDWDQGYGYQFWRSRHDTYRGDGAFGQYMMVMPQYDAVVAITSGVRDMQAVMNLVWDKLLPAFSPTPLADNPGARGALKAKLATLSVRTPSGRANAALSARVSRRWYDVPANDRGIKAVSLDLDSPTPALLVSSTTGETRLPIGMGSWERSAGDFNSGIDQMLSVLPKPAVAASGAWTADSVFTVKLVAPETPFYSTLALTFSGEKMAFDTEYNVSFDARKLPQLVGNLRAGP